MTKRAISSQIRDNCHWHVTTKRNSGGNLMIRNSFFYRHGNTQQTFSNDVTDRLTELNVEHRIINCGEHYTAFRGGDTVPQGSHWWVEVKILDAELNLPRRK